MNSPEASQSDSAILPIGNSIISTSHPQVCVSVGRGRHRMMLAERDHLAANGANLVELRLDFVRRAVNVSRLLAGKQCELIATCRRRSEGGRWEKSESDRQGLLRTAIACGFEYVDLEHDIAEDIPRYGDTKRIVSYHNFNETPEDIAEIHKRLCDLDADIVKIVTLANNPMDNFTLLRLNRDSKLPTVAFCMGEMGLPSRVLCGKFGSPFTYASFNKERSIAPGQLSYKQMTHEYRFSDIGKSTKVYGVIADPVGHSLSPRVHNKMLREAKIDAVYLPFRVPAEHLDPFMDSCREFGVDGLSVTIPHKEKVLRHISVLDENVVGIRACNTMVFKGRDAFGYNTDCAAAMEVLKREIEINDKDVPFDEMRVLILGAGGVARALGFGLIRGGAVVHVTSRDFKKADELAQALKCKAIDWPARANHTCDVIINATPAGMSPNLDESPFEEDWFESHQVVFDTVYNPEQTLFIKYARKAGCRTVTGVDMFVRQAAAQFKLFTGKEPNVSVGRREIKRATSPARF